MDMANATHCFKFDARSYYFITYKEIAPNHLQHHGLTTAAPTHFSYLTKNQRDACHCRGGSPLLRSRCQIVFKWLITRLHKNRQGNTYIHYFFFLLQFLWIAKILLLFYVWVDFISHLRVLHSIHDVCDAFTFKCRWVFVPAVKHLFLPSFIFCNRNAFGTVRERQ